MNALYQIIGYEIDGNHFLVTAINLDTDEHKTFTIDVESARKQFTLHNPDGAPESIVAFVHQKCIEGILNF